MSTDVIMPQMGESVAEGTITKWFKQVGDMIVRDEPLFEISTDKVDAEIPAPAAGILADFPLVHQHRVERVATDDALVAPDGRDAVVGAFLDTHAHRAGFQDHQVPNIELCHVYFLRSGRPAPLPR